MRVMSVILSVVTLLAVAGAGAAVEAQDQNKAQDQNTSARKPAVASVSIAIVVDGEVRKTWAGAELAEKQFIGQKRTGGGFRPMVNLTDALPFDSLGVSRERLDEIVIKGETGKGLHLKGPALEYLGDLRLQIDVDKGGVWKLLPKTKDVEKSLSRLTRSRKIVVQDVRRIELTTSPPSPPKS